MLENTFDVLNKLNVSLAEYFVMCPVGYRIFLPPHEWAQTSVNLSEGDPRGQPTLVEHLKAVDSCLWNGWFEVLTPEECERVIARRQSSAIPEIVDHPEPNTVDFTQKGHTLFRQIILNIFGSEHVRKSDAGWNLDEDNQVANIYAETNDLCQACIKEFTDDPSSCTGEAAEVVNVSHVESIGAWRPNRFVTLPHGFHACVRYEIIES